MRCRFATAPDVNGAEMPTDAGFRDFEYYLLFIFLFPVSALDIKHKQIPAVLISAAIVVFIFLGVTRDGVPDYQIYTACVIGYSYIYFLHVFSKGKIGLGDAKISALIALVLGLKLWIWALIFASMLGIMYGAVSVRLKKLELDSKIPYAPFLTLGCYLVLLLKNLRVYLI